MSDTTEARRLLDEALRRAHEAHETQALISLYTQAAETAEATGDAEAAGFYLTHAYVFALEQGSTKAPALHARLVAMGRETALHPASPPLR